MAESDQARSETQKNDDDSTDNILAAAQRLMQLSDGYNNDDDEGHDVKRKRKRIISGEEVDQRPDDHNIISTKAKMNEIIRNDIGATKRKKKYRSLAEIYRVTKPIYTDQN